MIKEELRIGNQLENGTIFELLDKKARLRLDENNEIKDFEYEHLKGYKLNLISKISLTEFKIQENLEYPFQQLIYINNSINRYGQINIYIQEHKIEIDGIEVNFLHQLQNIFYDITGKELKYIINPNKLQF